MAEAQFTEGNVVDHRDAAIAALRSIAQKLGDIYSGANDFDEDAWDLFGIASEKVDNLIEDFDKETFHSGLLVNALRPIVALMHGAQLILEGLGTERNIEEEGALSLVTKYVPMMGAHVDTLNKQSHRERSGVQKVEVEHG